MHVIDVGETALVEGLRVAPRERGKGVAGLLGHFYSQSVKRQHPGVKVALLTRDNQLGPQELKKYRLIAKQVRRTREIGGQRLSPGASGRFPLSAHPVTGFLLLLALTSGGAHEPCPGTPSPYPGPSAQRKSNSSPLPVCKRSVLTSGRWSPGVRTSMTLPPLHRSCLPSGTQTS